MAFALNDRIKLTDGDRAVIKFIGKTRLDDTLWFGIEYLSSLISPYKPTLVKLSDIKTRKKLNKSRKKHKKTTSSISYLSNNYKNSSKYRKNKKLNPLNSSCATKDFDHSIMKQQITAALTTKTANTKQKNSRSSSAPSKEIKALLHCMDAMDVNNTVAISDNFDSLISTIDMPEQTKSESLIKKNKNRRISAKYKQKSLKNKRKRRNKYHSDITNSVRSSPSLKKKTKKTKKTKLNINFENKKNQKTSDFPNMNPIMTEPKSENKIKFEINDSNIESDVSEFGALIEDESVTALNEGKEIESDSNYKQQYSNIFTSVKTKNKSKNGSLKKLKLNKKEMSKSRNESGTFKGKIEVGKRYLLTNERYGICRYFGCINDENNIKYIGIELEFGQGNCDGFVNGKQYFKCILPNENNKKGLFVRKSDIKQDLGFDDVMD